MISGGGGSSSRVVQLLNYTEAVQQPSVSQAVRKKTQSAVMTIYGFTVLCPLFSSWVITHL